MTNAALVAKLESAQEGSRKLDALIHIALHDPDIMTGTGGYRGELPVKYQKASTVFTETWTDWDGAALAMDAPHYTTNLQDAVDLVPEGWGWAAAELDLGKPSAVLTNREPQLKPGTLDANPNKKDFRSKGATPALALSIAILKAVEAKDG